MVVEWRYASVFLMRVHTLQSHNAAMIKDTKENFLEVWLNINDSSQRLEVHARREIKLPHSRPRLIRQLVCYFVKSPSFSPLLAPNSRLVSPHLASQSNIFFSASFSRVSWTKFFEPNFLRFWLASQVPSPALAWHLKY